MLPILTELNLRIVEKEWWMCGCVLERIYCACLVRSGLNDIFHWYFRSCIFNRSLLSDKAEVFTQFTMLNKEVSSAKSLTSEFSPCGWSFT